MQRVTIPHYVVVRVQCRKKGGEKDFPVQYRFVSSWLRWSEGAAMGDESVRYVGGWIGRQRRLFPHVAEEIDPVTAKLEQLIVILDTLGLEAYVATPHRGPGRPPEDRPAIARAFVGKAVLNIPTTVALIERLQTDRSFRRICGWERRDQLPSEAKFSRVFKEFADQALPERVHEQLIRHGLGEHLLGHLARDATEIDAREKPQRKPPSRRQRHPSHAAPVIDINPRADKDRKAEILAERVR